MRRRHTRDQYLDLVARIRGEVPDVALSTDVIVGFPGETEADFHESLSLVEHVRFDGMFSFKYSPRPGTLARQRMPDDVAEAEKTRRLQALQGLQQGIQLQKHRAQVGLTVRVLIDSTSLKSAQEMSGRTTGNTVVNLAGERTWLGCFADVLVERAGPNSLRGRAVRVEPAPAS
jgi:tRNA-2-methylthio-N6-dimethylallyladenosine synthase